MANPTESVEKYATAVLSGSLMALALLLAVDGQAGGVGVFSMLSGAQFKDNPWNFVAIVPALAIIYALGLIVNTGSALFAKRWDPKSQEKEKYALALIAAAKNDLLNQKFAEIVRSWKTLEGMVFPLIALLIGILLEWKHYPALRNYLSALLLLVAVLAVLCPRYAWHLAKSVDDVLNAALDGAGAKLSISVESDRRPISEKLDAMSVTIKLIKGDRGSIDLHDAKGRVLYPQWEEPLRFTDAVRLDFASTNPVVVWGMPNKERSQIRLSPGGTTEMSAHCPVPREQVCKIEVVILGSVLDVFRPGPTPPRYHAFLTSFGRLFQSNKIRQPPEDKEPVFSQWRASHVSLPTRSLENCAVTAKKT